MTRSVYKNQRIIACFVGYIFCYIAFKNELYYEFILETALTSTSMWYHMTESALARKIDIITAASVAPTVMILSICKNNYYPLFFNSLIIVGYFYMSVSGTMREHFLYVHIPALLSQLSSSIHFKQRLKVESQL
jgi:hypothetical protein